MNMIFKVNASGERLGHDFAILESWGFHRQLSEKVKVP